MSPLEKQTVEEYGSGRGVGGQCSLQEHKSYRQAKQTTPLTEQMQHGFGKQGISEWSQDFSRRSQQDCFRPKLQVCHHPQKQVVQKAHEKERLTQQARTFQHRGRPQTLRPASQQQQEDWTEQQSLQQYQCRRSLVVSPKYPPGSAVLCTVKGTNKPQEHFCCSRLGEFSGATVAAGRDGAVASNQQRQVLPKQTEHQEQGDSEASAPLQLMYTEPQRPAWIQQLQKRNVHQRQQEEEDTRHQERHEKWKEATRRGQKKEVQQGEQQQQQRQARREDAKRVDNEQGRPLQPKSGQRRITQEDMQRPQREEGNEKHEQQLTPHVGESPGWHGIANCFQGPAGMLPGKSPGGDLCASEQQQLLIGLPVQHQIPRFRHNFTRQQSPREHTFSPPQHQQRLQQQAGFAVGSTPTHVAQAAVPDRCGTDDDLQEQQVFHNRRNLRCISHDDTRVDGSGSYSGPCNSKASHGNSSGSEMKKSVSRSNSSSRTGSSSTRFIRHDSSHSNGRSSAKSTCASKSRSSSPQAYRCKASGKISSVVLNTSSSNNQQRCSDLDSRKRDQVSSSAERCSCCSTLSLNGSARGHTSVAEPQVSRGTKSQNSSSDGQKPFPEAAEEATATVPTSPPSAATYTPAATAGEAPIAAIVACEAALTTDAKASAGATERRAAVAAGRQREEGLHHLTGDASVHVNNDSEQAAGLHTAEGATVAAEQARAETMSMSALSDQAQGRRGVNPAAIQLEATALGTATSELEGQCERTRETCFSDLAFSFSCVNEINEEATAHDGARCSFPHATGADRDTECSGITRQSSATADLPRTMRPSSPANATVNASTSGVQTLDAPLPLVPPPPATKASPASGAAAAADCEEHVQSASFPRHGKCCRLCCAAEQHAKKRWKMLLRRSQRGRDSSRSSDSSFCTSLSSYISSSASSSDTEEDGTSSEGMREISDKDVIQSCEQQTQQYQECMSERPQQQQQHGRHQYQPGSSPVLAMRQRDHGDPDKARDVQHIIDGSTIAAAASADENLTQIFGMACASEVTAAASSPRSPANFATSLVGAEGDVTEQNNVYRECVADPLAMVNSSLNLCHMLYTPRRPPRATIDVKTEKSRASAAAGEAYSGQEALQKEAASTAAALIGQCAAAASTFVRHKQADLVGKAAEAAQRVAGLDKRDCGATASAEPCIPAATCKRYDVDGSEGSRVAVAGMSASEPAKAITAAAPSPAAPGRATFSLSLAKSKHSSRVRVDQNDHTEHRGTFPTHKVLHPLAADIIVPPRPLDLAGARRQVLTAVSCGEEAAKVVRYANSISPARPDAHAAGVGSPSAAAAAARWRVAPAGGIDGPSTSAAARAYSYVRRSSAEPPAADGDAEEAARVEAALVAAPIDTTSTKASTGEVASRSAPAAANVAKTISVSYPVRDQMTTSGVVCPSNEAAVAAATAAAYCEILLPAAVRRTLKIRMRLRRLSIWKTLQLRQALQQHEHEQQRCQQQQGGSEHSNEHTPGHVHDKFNSSPPDTRTSNVEKSARNHSTNIMDAVCETTAGAAAKQSYVSCCSSGPYGCTSLVGTAGNDVPQMQNRQRSQAYSNSPSFEARPAGGSGIAVESSTSSTVDGPTAAASSDSVAGAVSCLATAASARSFEVAHLAQSMSICVPAGNPHVNAAACRFGRAITRSYGAAASGGASTIVGASPQRAAVYADLAVHGSLRDRRDERAAIAVSGGLTLAAALNAASKGRSQMCKDTFHVDSPSAAAIPPSERSNAIFAAAGRSTTVVRSAASGLPVGADDGPAAHRYAAAISRERNIPEKRDAVAAKAEQHQPHCRCCTCVPRAVDQQLALLRLVNHQCAAEVAAVALAFAHQQRSK